MGHLGKWLVEVFWGPTTRIWWTAGSVLVAVITVLSTALTPMVRASIPLSALVVGFFVSSFYSYVKLANDLEIKKLEIERNKSDHESEIDWVTKQLSVALIIAFAWERGPVGAELTGLDRSAGDGSHTIGLNVRLDLRNKSASPNTLELKTCSFEIAEYNIHEFHFMGDPDARKHAQNERSWSLEGKEIAKPFLSVIISTPPGTLVNTLLTGVIVLEDVHNTSFDISFITPITNPFPQFSTHQPHNARLMEPSE